MDVKIERPDVMREKWLKELKMTMSQDKMKLIVKQENISSDHDSVKDGMERYLKEKGKIKRNRKRIKRRLQKY